MERLVSPRQRAPRRRGRICAGREKRKKASFTTETQRHGEESGERTIIRRDGDRSRTFALPSFLRVSVVGLPCFLAGCDCSPRGVPRDRPLGERSRGGRGLWRSTPGVRESIARAVSCGESGRRGWPWAGPVSVVSYQLSDSPGGRFRVGRCRREPGSEDVAPAMVDTRRRRRVVGGQRLVGWECGCRLSWECRRDRRNLWRGSRKGRDRRRGGR